MPPPQTPPPPPPQRHLLRKPAFVPEFIFTALSVFILLSPSNPANNILQKLSFPLNPRRFLKIPTMSLPSSNRLRNPNRPFPTPQSLSDWLKPRLPSDSFASWGVKPGTKNVNNLWLEISEGETSLADSTPPIRTVEVVVVRVIGKDNKVLVESHQELSNGNVRNRSRPLSEKMKPGETVDSAVFRAIKEELGSIIVRNSELNSIVRILPNSYVKKVEERVSASYPGLPACYVLHTIDATVEGLPEGEFCTEEAEEYEGFDDKGVAAGAVSCKKHYWKWVDSYSV
ncbi:uncharacterized protein LOC116019732 [Ipomoea triloba]|uniref:uncharacterized protein LOC116019732 n=1 Tax=Ipomoea triloba TaxID=35885 RepID=UPI00125D36CC|nr:uncharacterized protein LOC116019732 [Ipomoea triloba]